MKVYLNIDVFYLGHFCNYKFTKEDFLRNLLYIRHLEKSFFVNIDLIFNLKNSQKCQRRLLEKSSRINRLVLQLAKVCQKLDFL